MSRDRKILYAADDAIVELDQDGKILIMLPTMTGCKRICLTPKMWIALAEEKFGIESSLPDYIMEIG